jgi:hypothetical protein
MWAMPTNYGDDPAPPRYFLIKRLPPQEEAVDDRTATTATKTKSKTETKSLDWRQFVLTVVRALLPFPEAKDAVVAAFKEAGAEASP